jgi:hypothetical protein
MHSGACSAYVVRHNGNFSPAAKEQQAIHGMFDHRQSNPYVCRAGFGTLRNGVMQLRRYRSAIVSEIGNPI